MDFQTYSQANGSVHYCKQVAKPVTKRPLRLQVRMKFQMFDHMDQISMIGILHIFQKDCDYNGVYEGDEMRLFPLSFEKTASEAPSARLS